MSLALTPGDAAASRTIWRHQGDTSERGVSTPPTAQMKRFHSELGGGLVFADLAGLLVLAYRFSTRVQPNVDPLGHREIHG